MPSFEYEKYFEYFERSVLNIYRSSSHVYKVVEDDMGGEIRVTSTWDEKDEEKYSYINLQFGFRKLIDYTTCIALFTPNLKDKISQNEFYKWVPFRIKNPEFSKDDPFFKRWIERYIYGSWDVKNGPKFEIIRLIELISVLTKYSLGIPFFKYSENILLNYPSEENTEEYTKANLELYRLVIDGMQKDAIVTLSEYLNINLTDENKRLNSLKELLPFDKIQSIHKPIIKLSERRAPIHGLPKKGIQKFDAFSKFNEDLHEISHCLENLLIWLEGVLNTDAKSCKDREDSLHLFPNIVKPPRPDFKFADIQKAVGKTIKSIEFGAEEEHKEVHEREAIIFHFEDGTSMTIRVGSNAQNIHYQYENIKANEFSTDLMIFWVNAVKRKR
jgi:hypothetical protein